MIRVIAKVVYLLYGAISTVFGVTALVIPNALHPHSAASFQFRHNLREFGAAAVFIGLMGFWCALNYERSRTVHYLLTLFNFIVAAIHWYDYFNGDLPITSPLFNSIAFVVFASLAIARYREPASTIGV